MRVINLPGILMPIIMNMGVCPSRWGLRKQTHYLEIWVLALFAGLGCGRAGFIISKGNVLAKCFLL